MSSTYSDDRRHAFIHLQAVLLEMYASKNWVAKLSNSYYPERPPSDVRVNQAIYQAAHYVHETAFISSCLTIFKCDSPQVPTQLFNLLNKHVDYGLESPPTDVPVEGSYFIVEYEKRGPYQ